MMTRAAPATTHPSGRLIKPINSSANTVPETVAADPTHLQPPLVFGGTFCIR